MTEAIIHLGYGKTGTTTLQKHFFPYLEGLNYLGRPYKQIEISKAIRQIIYLDSSSYQIERKRIRDCFFNLKDNQPIIISEELLFDYRADPHRAIERLLDLFDKCRFLICLREQKNIIASYYSNHGWNFKAVPEGLKGRNAISFDDWYNFEKNKYDTYEPNIFNHLDYYNRLTTLYKLVDKESVGVFLFEEFRDSLETFLTKITSFLNIIDNDLSNRLTKKKENLSRSQKIRRRKIFSSKNTFFSLVDSIIPFSNKPFKLEKRYQTEIDSIYSYSNYKLQKEFDIDLQAFGYSVEKKSK